MNIYIYTYICIFYIFFYRYARPTSTKKKDEGLKALFLHFQNNVIQFALE